MQLPIKLPLELMQTKWASILNPFIAIPFLNGQLLTGIVLVNGVTVINHKLSRMQQGYVVTDQNASAAIYRSQPLNSTTLTLTSNASVTVALWVF